MLYLAVKSGVLSVEQFAGRILVGNENVDVAAMQHGLDGLHFIFSGGDTDDVFQAAQGIERGGDQT